MAITDPLTGVRQTPEQMEALTSQQREGLLARVEARLLAFQEQLTAEHKALDEQKARVDALEQARKVAEGGQVEKVAAHLSQREGNLVLVQQELRAELELLKKDFTELVTRINGLQPGFFTQTPPAPPVPVKTPPVVTHQAPPPARPMPTR
jgi:hypothetical protein